MEFWLDRGVAGFRFNAVGKLYENKDFLDEPHSVGREKWPVYYSLDHIYTHEDPEVYGTVAEWRAFMDEYSKRKNTFTRYVSFEWYCTRQLHRADRVKTIRKKRNFWFFLSS